MRYFSCAFLSLVLSQAFCNPEGFQLVLGEATPPSIDATGSMMIESGKNTVIQWDSFSIGELERVRFSQADSHSAVLNRVMGGSASALLGSLDSNGQVLLINPNGVLIGNNGLIQTAGFIASTADISNDEFLQQGNLHFAADSSASIINLGAIECPTGDIVLLARTVQNAGTLTAPDGLVTLAAGAEILIKPDGDERVFIQPTESDFASVENSGDIHALAVEMKSGRSPYLYAIKSSGNISTPKFAEQNGRIYIVADTGRTDVSGSLSAEGGEVRILGEEVIIENPLAIDVSSDTEGGTVLIGGDYQGKNPEIPSARMTYVGPNTSIKADARTSGNGGKVILWSTDKTGYYGSISAQGGSQGGDGGLAEVSGSYLDYRGGVNLLAAHGKTGELLLDPTDYTISAAADANYLNPPSSEQFYVIPTAVGATVNFTTLTGVGGLGTANVTISTSSSFGTAANGNITITTTSVTPFTWATANQLTLIAGLQIKFDTSGGPVAIKNTSGTTGFTAVSFQAGNSILIGTTASTAVNFASITTAGGDIVLEGIGKTPVGAPLQEASGIYVGPSCSVTSDGGNIRMYGVGGASINVASGAPGIFLDTSASVVTVGAEINMEGIGGNNSGIFNHGIDLAPSSKVSISNAGPIQMIGTGTGVSAIGIQLGHQSSVGAGSGDILMQGTGGDSDDGINRCIGIQMQGTPGTTPGTETQVFTAGSITMIGNGGPPISSSTGNSVGIQINDDTAIAFPLIFSSGGDIHLIGRGGGGGTFNDGILIQNTNPNEACIQSQAASGTVLLEGYGSASATENNRGVSLQNCGSAMAGVGGVISTLGADIIITGHGGGSASTNMGGNTGININNNPSGAFSGGTLIQSGGAGNIVLNGFGGPNKIIGPLSNGVSISNTPIAPATMPTGQTQILTSGGSVFINGESSSSSFGTFGVNITDIGTTIFPQGGGDLYINGTSLGGGVTAGVGINDTNPNVGQGTLQTEDGGSIYINGSATQNPAFTTFDENIGVSLNFVNFTTVPGPNILISGTGNITISGQGGVGDGFCPGVVLFSSSIQTDFGNIAITGNAVATGAINYGVAIEGGSLTTEASGMSMGQTGLISITGSGSVNGSDEASGVLIIGPTTTIATTNYNVTISGTGGGQLGTATVGRTVDLGNHGVLIEGEVLFTSVNGNFDISGSAAGNGDFNSGVVFLANGMGIPSITTTGTSGGYVNITGTSSQNAMAGSSNIGVDIVCTGGGASGPIVQTSGQNISITGTGCQTSTMGGSNYGMALHFLVTPGTNPLTLSSATGSIEINGYGGSGAGGTAHGIFLLGVSSATSVQINTASNTMTPPPGNISLFGRGGTSPSSSGVSLNNFALINGQGSIQIYGDSNGIASGNYGVLIDGDCTVSLTDPAVGSFGQTITIEGSASKNSAATSGNYGVFLGDTSIVESTTKNISISGYGAAQATSTDNVGLFLFASTVSSLSGNISLYGAGGAGTNAVTGVFFNAGTVTTTTGNVSVEGYGGLGATGFLNAGIEFSPGMFTTTSGNLSLYGVGGGGTNNNFGVYFNGGTISSTSGQMSFVGYGSPSASGTDNIGILLGNASTVMNTSGNVFFYGVGGSGTTDNTGVNFNLGTVSTTSGEIAVEGYGGTGLGFSTGIEIDTLIFTSSGNLSFYGVGGTGTAGGSPGINMDGGNISTTSGQMAFEGYGGQAAATGNHGVAVTAGTSITNSSGSTSFYGVGGSGTTNNIGVDFDTNSAVTNGSGPITVQGYGSPTGTDTDNHGIQVNGSAAVTTTVASASGSISLYGIGGTGTTGNHGVAITNGTSIANPSLLSTLSGDISITAESGSGSDSFGIDLDTFAQILTAGGNMFLLGNSNANAAGIVGGIGIQMGSNSLIEQSVAGGVTNAVLEIFARGSVKAGSTTNVGLNMNSPVNVAQINSGYSMVIVAESGLSGGVATNAINLGLNGIISTNTGTFGNLDIKTLSIDVLGGSLTVSSNSSITGGGAAASYMNFNIANNFNIGVAGMVGPASVFGVSGPMTVATKGNITVTAGSMLNNLATLGTRTGNLTVTTFKNITLNGGTASGTLALIGSSTGPINIRTIKNNVSGGGNVNLNGGIGSSAGAIISTAAPTIAGVPGHIMTVGGNLNLTGGTGSNAVAQIGNPGSGVVNTDILITNIGGNLILTGDANAIIGHGNPSTTATTLSGNITIEQVGGFVRLLGNTNAASAGGLAQIGHINQTAGGSTLSGNIYLNAGTSITLTGGTQGTGSNARIGHGGQSGATAFGASTMSIFAGTNLTLTTSSLANGLASIGNPSSTGGLTLITDNNNPLNPNFGANGLNIDLNSQLTTSGGQLRIYTAQQSTNSIPSGKIINGQPFVPGPIPTVTGTDTAYEVWNSYYGTHLYGGPQFTIFYKFPFISSTSPCPLCDPPDPPSIVVPGQFFELVNKAAVANMQLSDMLPTWDNPFQNEYPYLGGAFYHGQVCFSENTRIQDWDFYTECAEYLLYSPYIDYDCYHCSPNFYRYRAVIFENEVY